MDQFARIVLGYHGCNTQTSVAFAREVLNGTAEVENWLPSENSYDWLGHGIYFWEHGPQRAQRWAEEGDAEGIVIGAVIQLGRCFDLTDVNHTSLLSEVYESLAEEYRERDEELPTNGGPDWKVRRLDCRVINRFIDAVEMEVAGITDGQGDSLRYQTVRCAFEEGEAAFPGSMLKRETHIQIAVRDPDCILGVFRPNL